MENSRKRKKSLVRRRLKRNLLILFLVTVVMLVVWGLYNFFHSPFLYVVDDCVERRLSLIDIMQFKKEPTDRDVCWDAEIPGFVKKDIEYARKNELDIAYIFKKYIIYIYPQEDDEVRVSVHEEDFDYYGFIYDFENFSMYRNGQDELAIYGYTTDSNWFMRYSLREEDAEEDVLTYHTNIPFSIGNMSVSANDVGEYTLIRDDDFFCFYRNGKKVSAQKFTEEIKKLDIYNGLILTTDNQLYVMYVNIEEGKPVLTYLNIGKADEISDYDYIISGDRTTTPIINRDGKKYTIIPNDWETFEAASVSNSKLNVTLNKPDYTVNLVCLEDVFKSATFDYNEDSFSGKRWSAEICYDLNGIEFFDRSYDIIGYDDIVSLPEQVYEKNEITVYSLDEFWNQIKNIRTIYFDYYDNEGL